MAERWQHAHYRLAQFKSVRFFMDREQVFSIIYLITSNFSILPITNFAHRNLPPETRNHRGLQREKEAIIFKESVAVLSPERRDLSTFRSKGEIGAPFLPSFLLHLFVLRHRRISRRHLHPRSRSRTVTAQPTPTHFLPSHPISLQSAHLAQ